MIKHHTRTSPHALSFIRLIAAFLLAILAFTPQQSLQAAPLAQDPGPTITDAGDQAAAQPLAQQPVEEGSFLILLQPPRQLPTDEMPARLEPFLAQEYVSTVLKETARNLITELKDLESQGEIAGFALDPDKFAVRVQYKPEAVEEQITQKLQDNSIAAIVPSGAPVPSCATDTSKELARRIQITSYDVASRRAALEPGLNATADDAVGGIEIYLNPGSSYTYVRGKVAANSLVNMEIRRVGFVIGSDTAYSDSSGFYYIYPYSGGCGSENYSWNIQPGDEVTVTVGPTTYRTTATLISAWINPTANTAGGSTAAGRKVDVVLETYASGPCNITYQVRSAYADGSGNYSITGFSDFDRRSMARVHTRDGGGNSTFMYAYAFRLSGYTASPYDIYGFARPYLPMTVYYTRGGALQQTINTTADYDGWFIASFTNPLQPNDVIHAEGSGVSITYTYTSLTASFNTATNQLYGTTGANRLVQAYQNHPSVQFVGSCSSSTVCASGYANGAGSYAIQFPNLSRGDYFSMYVYDGEGNYQYSGRMNSVSLALDLSYNYVEGTWYSSSTDLNISITRGGSVIYNNTTTTNSEAEFSRYVSSLQVNDIVRVSQGATFIEMTVPSLSAQINSGTNRVTGSGPAGHVVGNLYDFNASDGYSYRICNEADSGGSFTLAYTGVTFGGWDYGDVIVRDGNDNYAYVTKRAFSVGLYKDDSYLYGYTDTPNLPVTITHKRGGATLGTYNVTSSSSGSFYNYLSGVNRFLQGDQVIVDPADATSNTLTVPPLTVNRDGPNNTVYGTAPANTRVSTNLRRYYGPDNYSSYSTTVSTWSNSSGNYAVNFNGILWSRNCMQVQVGHACGYARAYLYNTQANAFYLYPPSYPSMVPADGYEGDDSAGTAKTIANQQLHTFHTNSDVDWVRFVAVHDPSDGVQPFTITLSNLGWNMGVRMTLYTSDGATALLGPYDFDEVTASRTFYYNSSSIDTPFLLKFEPVGSYSYGACDSNYTLTYMTLNGQRMLPMVIH